MAALLARGDVKFAQLNYIITTAVIPNDPSFYLQWGLYKIDAPGAWDIHTGDSNIVVAVVDTGVDLDHPDLQAGLWLNNDEIPANGVDDDGNGYIDDVNGWDFCNTPSGGSTCTLAPDNNPDDENSHGSHVAGIAAASGNNNKGIAGLSWAATIMPVKALDRFGSGTINSVANGINYAVANGARVINLSLGAGGTSYPCAGFGAIRDAMQDALARDILVVVASGNQGATKVACPAALDEAFAVGATTSIDFRWSGSNRGERLDIAAPGQGIYSTIQSGGYGYKTGTSMATPHVAGLVALLQSFSPGLVHDEDIRSVIEVTAADLGLPGHDDEYGHGRINARRALESLVSLQTSPARIDFLIDESSGSMPDPDYIQVISNDSNYVTWTAVISPSVSWLSLSPPTSGVVSTASSPIELTLVSTRPLAYGTHNTTVIVTGTNLAGLELGARRTKVFLNYVAEIKSIYLPLIQKSPAPDLVVDSVTVASNNVQVVIKNQGSAPVTDAFWVDLYVDPHPVPTGVNQLWNDGRSTFGLVWGVTAPALPLAPNGGTLTLTIGDEYYYGPPDSNFPASLPVGTPVYVQVDSVNFNTSYGNVLENHEISDGAYNNIRGPIFSILNMAGAAAPPAGRDPRSTSTGPLPPR
jgi:hypothetical protein